jgi:hypothetical protein
VTFTLRNTSTSCPALLGLLLNKLGPNRHGKLSARYRGSGDCMSMDRALELRDKLQAAAAASDAFADASGELAKTLTGAAARSAATAAAGLAAACLEYAAAFDAIPAESILAVLAILKPGHGEMRH